MCQPGQLGPRDSLGEWTVHSFSYSRLKEARVFRRSHVMSRNVLESTGQIMALFFLPQ